MCREAGSGHFLMSGERLGRVMDTATSEGKKERKVTHGKHPKLTLQSTCKKGNRVTLMVYIDWDNR